MGKIRVLLIEDNRILREGIKSLLNGNRDIETTISEGSNDALRKAKEENPNVILIDLVLQTNESINLINALKKEAPAAKYIVMDFMPLHEDIMSFVEAGVSGFILKEASFEEFSNTIRSVANGEKILPSSMTNSLFSQIVEHAISGGKIKPNDSISMTAREKEIIRLISEGLSNKEIAQKLCISTDTVKSHVHNILEKLSLRSRLQIAAYARKRT